VYNHPVSLACTLHFATYAAQSPGPAPAPAAAKKAAPEKAAEPAPAGAQEPLLLCQLPGRADSAGGSGGRCTKGRRTVAMLHWLCNLSPGCWSPYSPGKLSCDLQIRDVHEGPRQVAVPATPKGRKCLQPAQAQDDSIRYANMTMTQAECFNGVCRYGVYLGS
jgi:hypothetical protein